MNLTVCILIIVVLIAFVVMAFEFVGRVRKFFSGDAKQLVKSASAVKIGVLGCAKINPPALFYPARKLNNVHVFGIAARDFNRAKKCAADNYIPKVYENYEALLQDKEIEAVYIPLPNSHHFEWARRAIAHGKHLLCEKPLTNNAFEARQLADEAKKANLLLVEAFHYRYHPLAQAVRNVIRSGELGSIECVRAHFLVPKMFFGAGNIRFDYKLGGGATMDLGCYTINIVRYMCGLCDDSVSSSSSSTGSNSDVEVIDAVPVCKSDNPDIDIGMDMTLSLRISPSTSSTSSSSSSSSAAASKRVTAKLRVSMDCGGFPETGSFEAVCSSQSLFVNNLLAPSFWHYVEIRDTISKQLVRTMKVYDDGYSTYYYQLNAFARAVESLRESNSSSSSSSAASSSSNSKNEDSQAKRASTLSSIYTSLCPTSGEDAVKNMQVIDDVYKKAKMRLRGH